MDVMIDRATTILRRGGIVAYPTDTLYGLAADPRSTEAIARLFEVKGRGQGHAIPLIAADVGQVDQAGVLTAMGQRLAEMLWPGPLSLVIASRSAIVPQVRAADDSIAIRIPANDTARALAEALGFCITATSANLSGEAATADPIEVWSGIGDFIDFLLDKGSAPGGPPSTIVDVRGPRVRLVRAGAVPWERVLESLQ
jgi:L-threonylcarbamoyladenylate synthase